MIKVAISFTVSFIARRVATFIASKKEKKIDQIFGQLCAAFQLIERQPA